jgi:cytochrome subunit of sulfide dehydrogenase
LNVRPAFARRVAGVHALARFTPSLRAALCVFAAACILPAHAQPEALRIRTLAANCAQCHGTDGRAAPGSALPSIAGRPRDDLLAQLQAFKAGTRPSTIMQQLARGYTDAQLAQLAGFFAAQKP